MSTSLRRLPGVGQLCPQPSPNPTGSAWCPEMSPNCWPTLNVPKCPEIGGALFLTANEYTAQSAMRDCCKLTRNSRRHGIAPHWPVLLYSLRWPEDNVAPQSMCVSPLEVLFYTSLFLQIAYCQQSRWEIFGDTVRISGHLGTIPHVGV